MSSAGWRLAALVAALSLPAAAADAPRLVLRWREVPGASAYEVQIARDAAFQEVVLQSRSTVPAYRWAQLPADTHWWRVRSVDQDGRPSEWSVARTVAVDAVVPELLRPAGGALLPCGAPVEVELGSSVMVREYVLEVAVAPSFAGARELRQPEPLFKLGPLAAGTWHLRASAVDVRGRRAGPGPVVAVTVRVTAPRARPPPEVLLGTPQVVLSWSEVACARGYLVEAIAESRDRVTMAAPEPSLPVMPKLAGDYRFRVAGVDEAGTSGEWSAEAVLRVRLPPPVPRAEVVGELAELAWAPVPSAVGYRVELAPEGGGAAAPQAAAVAASPWRSAVLAPGTYQWRVQARDAQGHLSAFSEARAFEVRPRVPLATPAWRPGELVIPLGAGAALAWDPVPDATRYEVELDGAPLAPQEAPSLRSAPLAEGWHQARVRALLPPARESPWSEPLELFAGVPPVAEALLRRDGEAVEVSLLDRLGRPVEAAAPRFSVAGGALEAAQLQGGWWRMRWRPPPGGEGVLAIDERAFHAERPLAVESLAPGWVDLQVGAILSGGALSSPSMALGLGWRLPLLQRRLGLELRASLASTGATLVVGGLTWRATAVLVPVALLAQWQQPLGPVVLRGAVGPALVVAAVTVDEARQVRVLPALELGVSVGLAVGPGLLELELGYEHARLDGDLARLNAGGFTVRLGYALDLGVR